jgi:hypothetical protein
VTALTRCCRNCMSKLQTHPLIRDGAPQEENDRCPTVIQMWLRGLRWMPDTKTDWPTDCQSQYKFSFSKLVMESQRRVSFSPVSQLQIFRAVMSQSKEYVRWPDSCCGCGAGIFWGTSAIGSQLDNRSRRSSVCIGLWTVCEIVVTLCRLMSVRNRL